ncbi:GMP synthase PP-ATPase subunit [Bradyrhizobium sp. AZCC 1719]
MTQSSGASPRECGPIPSCSLKSRSETGRNMTADFYPFDMSFLGQTATRIINEVKG